MNWKTNSLGIYSAVSHLANDQPLLHAYMYLSRFVSLTTDDYHYTDRSNQDLIYFHICGLLQRLTTRFLGPLEIIAKSRDSRKSICIYYNLTQFNSSIH